jgi:glycosyltransferase involved in cell wall biosynthesis
MAAFTDIGGVATLLRMKRDFTSTRPVQGLVSVVIANHNYGRYLRDCIDSVLAQTYPAVEVIVVDDGSTDESRDVLRSYEGRIHIILQENRGQGVAFDAGVAASAGEFICFLDSDDGWYPHKAERVVDAFTRQPRADWLRHKLAIVDEALAPLDRFAPPFEGSGLVPPDRRLFLERIVLAGTALAVRRSVIDRVFPIGSPKEFAYADDMLLLARIFAARLWGYSLDEVLGFYRRHSGQRFGQDVPKLLQHGITVSTAVARLLGRNSSVVFKNRLILAALDGAPWWSAQRLGPLLGGLQTTFMLLPRPRLFIRQTGALLFAYAAPRRWVRRLEQMHAFAGNQGTSVGEPAQR